jgi:thiosulfate/3-mercaptopyruvate sulfurtransferase
MLNWLGHSATAVLDGGMAAWDRFGGEVETALPNAVPRRFDARVNEEMVISTDDVVRKLSGADDFILVDARDEQRFLGNVEPIDSVAGHVPGARNFPFSKSINADGTWKASENLAAAWRGLLTTAPGGEWAVMCGSGVTACHLALSASLARIPAPRMYVGSWSEWIRDTDRPVATGRGPGSAD